jgi:hypothetical protein
MHKINIGRYILKKKYILNVEYIFLNLTLC